MKLTATAMLFALVLTGCDTEATQSSTPRATETPAPSSTKASQPFDRLTIELELRSTIVTSGGSVGSRLIVRNESGRPVTDPGCRLYAPSYGLIPADDPDAELWGQVVVDCSGPFTFKPGYVDRSVGPTFQAADKFGDPLPPGEYLAGMALEGLSERILVPIEVTP